MSLFGAMNSSASALTAERLRLELISENLANAQTTRSPDGGPYRRKMAAFSARGQRFAGLLGSRLAAGQQLPRGVVVTGIYEDPRPFQRVHSPGHPDADAEGFVMMPNVDVVEEMVNLVAATRAYEANISAFNAAKSMVLSALEIGR